MTNTPLAGLETLLEKLHRQLDFLPKLRDGLRDLAQQVDDTIDDRKKPGRAPAKKRKASPRPFYVSKLPSDAEKVPGIRGDYWYSPSQGMLSLRKGKVRVLGYGAGVWSVAKTRGGRMSISKTQVHKRLKIK